MAASVATPSQAVAADVKSGVALAPAKKPLTHQERVTKAFAVNPVRIFSFLDSREVL